MALRLIYLGRVWASLLCHTYLILQQQLHYSPTLAVLLRRYPHTFGTQDNSLDSGDVFWVNETFTMLPRELKKLNYTTHMMGKWHLGSCHPALTPMGQGFDTYYGMWYGAHQSYYTHRKGNTYDWWDGWNIDLTAEVWMSFQESLYGPVEQCSFYPSWVKARHGGQNRARLFYYFDTFFCLDNVLCHFRSIEILLILHCSIPLPWKQTRMAAKQ